MRYVMKQKVWGLGDDYIIRDAEGNDVFLVDGKVFSLGHKLSFQDMEGGELAFISQKLLSFRPTYELYRNGALFATVQKDFTFFRDHFTVDVPGPNDYEVSGNSWTTNTYSEDRQGKSPWFPSAFSPSPTLMAWISWMEKTTSPFWPPRSSLISSWMPRKSAGNVAIWGKIQFWIGGGL